MFVMKTIYKRDGRGKTEEEEGSQSSYMASWIERSASRGLEWMSQSCIRIGVRPLELCCWSSYNREGEKKIKEECEPDAGDKPSRKEKEGYDGRRRRNGVTCSVVRSLDFYS